MILLYLDPGSGSFLVQIIMATISGVGIYIVYHFKSRINFVVLVGALIVSVCGFLPIPHCWNDKSGILICLAGAGVKMLPLVIINLVLGLAILILMFFKWKWRGIPWIVLSFIGTVIGVLYANTLFQIYRGPSALPLVAGFPLSVSEIEQLIVIIGYIIIICGGIWDITRKSKQTLVADMPKIESSDEVEDDDE